MAKDQYLAGKLAIVTGAGKPNGIGAAAAYALAEHGADVSSWGDGVGKCWTKADFEKIVIHYGRSSAAAAETVKKIEAIGVKAVWTPHHFEISCQFNWSDCSLQVAIPVDQESETFGQDLIQATLKAFNTETIDIIVNNAVSWFT